MISHFLEHEWLILLNKPIQHCVFVYVVGLLRTTFTHWLTRVLWGTQSVPSSHLGPQQAPIPSPPPPQKALHCPFAHILIFYVLVECGMNPFRMFDLAFTLNKICLGICMFCYLSWVSSWFRQRNRKIRMFLLFFFFFFKKHTNFFTHSGWGHCWECAVNGDTMTGVHNVAVAEFLHMSVMTTFQEKQKTLFL